jgi:hypothetical protein
VAHDTWRGARGMTLALVAPGDSVRIREILFAQLSSDCARIGVRVGDVLTCRSASAVQLDLSGRDGRRVLLNHDWARWIVIDRDAV